MIGKEM